jgi:deazaflavin-dependent oxidoreductase (nitroreductase family)
VATRSGRGPLPVQRGSIDVRTRTIAPFNKEATVPQNPFNLKLIEEYRANEGRLTLSLGNFSLKDAKMLLLNTTGRRTGERHTAPMGYWLDGEDTYVLGIDQGNPKHPQWYWNLLANPEVTVERGAETYLARATVVEDDTERERLISTFGKTVPPMEAIVRGMTRRVPVVRLDRI